jgi:hypothetical protein
MRGLWFVLLALVVSGTVALSGSRAATNNLKGDYVEVRTASVFAGACHYNGELTTAGREALMAWSVSSGRWGDVDLAGVRALAVVSADANLADPRASRRTELIVDESASYAQAVAFASAVKSKYGAVVGRVVVVRSAPVSFKHEGQSYRVDAPGVASIDAEAMPDDMCCRMPQLVWYDPLVPLGRRKVGYTTKAEYAGGAAGDAWQRTGENSAFYGGFSL